MPGPPRSIKVVVDSQDAVVVSWLPPAQPNGVIVQYNIYVRSVEMTTNYYCQIKYKEFVCPTSPVHSIFRLPVYVIDYFIPQ